MNFETTGAALACLLAVSGAAQGPESLSCRVQSELRAAAVQSPKATDFVWGAAHDSFDASGAIKTSIGAVAQGEALGAITLGGRQVQLPAEVSGLILFGKVYDYGDRVVLAYRVEREQDSSASPSEVVYTLDKTLKVSDVDILPGSEMEAPGHCTLVE